LGNFETSLKYFLTKPAKNSLKRAKCAYPAAIESREHDSKHRNRSEKYYIAGSNAFDKFAARKPFQQGFETSEWVQGIDGWNTLQLLMQDRECGESYKKNAKDYSPRALDFRDSLCHSASSFDRML
jgi:hypothetical protein